MRGVFKTFCQDPYRLDREGLLRLWDEFDKIEHEMMWIIPDSHWCETHRRTLYWSPEIWEEVDTTSEDINESRS